MSQVGSSEPAWRRAKSDGCFGHPAHSRLVEVDSTDLGFADLRWLRKLLQQGIGDEALIDAAQRIHEPRQDAFASLTIWGNFSRERPQRSSRVLWTTASM